MFSRLKEEISVVFDRDPLRATPGKSLPAIPVFMRRSSTVCRTGCGRRASSGWPASFLISAAGSRASRSTPVLTSAAASSSTTAWGRHRRNGPDRRRLHALPRCHARRHVLGERASATRRSATALWSAPAPRRSSGRSRSETGQDRFQRSSGQAGSRRRDGHRHSGAHRRVTRKRRSFRRICSRTRRERPAGPGDPGARKPQRRDGPAARTLRLRTGAAGDKSGSAGRAATRSNYSTRMLIKTLG